MPGRRRIAALSLAVLATTACSGSPGAGVFRFESDAVLFIEARPTGYEPAQAAAATTRALVVDFTNADPASSHSISIFASDGRAVLRGERTEPGQSVRYYVGRLPTDAYTLRCEVFPASMAGVLSVVGGVP